MKKFVSLLMTAILLAAMLCVFAVPASAVENFTVIEGKKDIIESDEEYNTLHVYGILVVCRDVTLTANDILLRGALILEPGAKIKAKTISGVCATICVPSGSTIEVDGEFATSGAVFLESGAILKAKTYNAGGCLTVSPGATLITSDIEGGNIDLYGSLKNDEGVYFSMGEASIGITYRHGALVDVTCKDSDTAKQLAQKIGKVFSGNHVYRHEKHTFNPDCVNCGAQPGSNTGSTLSEGNLTIIVGITSAVVFGLGGFILGKKKKPALASGTDNTDE